MVAIVLEFHFAILGGRSRKLGMRVEPSNSNRLPVFRPAPESKCAPL
jgi:hypothetical protein